MTILASMSSFEGYATVIAKRTDGSNINYPGVLVRISDLSSLLDVDLLTYKPTAFTVDMAGLQAIGGLNDPKKKSKTEAILPKLGGSAWIWPNGELCDKPGAHGPMCIEYFKLNPMMRDAEQYGLDHGGIRLNAYLSIDLLIEWRFPTAEALRGLSDYIASTDFKKYEFEVPEDWKRLSQEDAIEFVQKKMNESLQETADRWLVPISMHDNEIIVGIHGKRYKFLMHSGSVEEFLRLAKRNQGKALVYLKRAGELVEGSRWNLWPTKRSFGQSARRYKQYTQIKHAKLETAAPQPPGFVYQGEEETMLDERRLTNPRAIAAYKKFLRKHKRTDMPATRRDFHARVKSGRYPIESVKAVVDMLLGEAEEPQDTPGWHWNAHLRMWKPTPIGSGANRPPKPPLPAKPRLSVFPQFRPYYKSRKMQYLKSFDKRKAAGEDPNDLRAELGTGANSAAQHTLDKQYQYGKPVRPRVVEPVPQASTKGKANPTFPEFKGYYKGKALDYRQEYQRRPVSAAELKPGYSSAAKHGATKDSRGHGYAPPPLHQPVAIRQQTIGVGSTGDARRRANVQAQDTPEILRTHPKPVQKTPPFSKFGQFYKSQAARVKQSGNIHARPFDSRDSAYASARRNAPVQSTHGQYQLRGVPATGIANRVSNQRQADEELLARALVAARQADRKAGTELVGGDAGLSAANKVLGGIEIKTAETSVGDEKIRYVDRSTEHWANTIVYDPDRQSFTIANPDEWVDQHEAERQSAEEEEPDEDDDPDGDGDEVEEPEETDPSDVTNRDAGWLSPEGRVFIGYGEHWKQALKLVSSGVVDEDEFNSAMDDVPGGQAQWGNVSVNRGDFSPVTALCNLGWSRIFGGGANRNIGSTGRGLMNVQVGRGAEATVMKFLDAIKKSFSRVHLEDTDLKWEKKGSIQDVISGFVVKQKVGSPDAKPEEVPDPYDELRRKLAGSKGGRFYDPETAQGQSAEFEKDWKKLVAQKRTRWVPPKAASNKPERWPAKYGVEFPAREPSGMRRESLRCVIESVIDEMTGCAACSSVERPISRKRIRPALSKSGVFTRGSKWNLRRKHSQG